MHRSREIKPHFDTLSKPTKTANQSIMASKSESEASTQIALGQEMAAKFLGQDFYSGILARMVSPKRRHVHSSRDKGDIELM